ncbi:MAG: serine/threonine protein kinase [Lachnospiraceae bacterium]|nr:serine/threonine protein kinase [Lachnospiraceae bacterium]
MLEIGSLVDGKYKILSEIGHGGMSVVYMAINEKANKTWAIKEVRKDGVLDFEAVRQGLIVETDMLKKLKHAYLPSIVDVIENENSFLIVMDYIEGNALSTTLMEYGPLPQEYVIEWAKQLCDVLGYLHSRTPAIIYRDMKPANIMLKPDGTITLIDFGTAREYKEKNLADTTCLGTIGYAAPEQFGGMGQTDARTDIYCLGTTLYHLVTGHNPSEPPYEVKPIREINPTLSSGLENIILKCVQKDPEERYQSCAELMYDLEHYDEIDDMYQKAQKKKLGGFVLTLCMSILFGIAGLLTNYASQELASDEYLEIIADAEKTLDYDEKVELYRSAMLVSNKAGEKEAYLGLIKLFKEDSKYDIGEEEILVKSLKNNKEELKDNVESFVESHFETAKLYWYYYEYGEDSMKHITRAKLAVPWFQEVIQNASEDYPNLGMAKAYAFIGEFYRDVDGLKMEASDRGLYMPFFQKLDELMTAVCEDDKESEMVKLEMLELARFSIHKYATDFKKDGVTEDEILSLFDRLNSYLEGVRTTTDMTDTMKLESLKMMVETQKAITTAYGTKGDS